MIDLDTLSRADGLLFVGTFVLAALFLGWVGSLLDGGRR